MAAEVRRGPALAFALALLLLVPAAAAHLQGARPILQRAERARIVDVDPDGLAVNADLTLQIEPLRHRVKHALDPAQGRFAVAYRADASLPSTEFGGRWDFGRLLEYRDVNTNGRWDPTVDAAAKVWRFSAYQWTNGTIQRVQVGGVQGYSVVWTGDLTAAPQVRVEAVVAGLEFDDEGVRVRPQDVALYLDFLDLPPRGVGHLYAMEWEVSVPASARLSLHEVENTSTALLADSDLRRSLFLWGGEALIDNAETRIVGTLAEERLDTAGNKSARITLHIPTADESLRFVMVSAVEYETESKRSPGVGVLALLGLVALAAVGMRRRAR